MNLTAEEFAALIWPVYGGAAFNLWEPDTGVYYASTFAPMMIEHLARKNRRPIDPTRFVVPRIELSGWMDTDDAHFYAAPLYASTPVEDWPAPFEFYHDQKPRPESCQYCRRVQAGGPLFPDRRAGGTDATDNQMSLWALTPSAT